MRMPLLAVALAATLASPALAGQIRTVAFHVPEMSACPSCPYIIQSMLSSVDGVAEVETVYETGIATVVYDDAEVTPADLGEALAEYGYAFEQVAPER